MGPSQGMIGKGTIVSYGTLEDTANEESFTPFLEVYDSTFPKLVTKDVNVTHYLSPDGILEYTPGWADGGEVTIKANYRADQQVIIQGLRGVTSEFQILFPDGSSFIWPGYIKDISGEIPNEDKITCTVAIKVSGALAFYPAA